MDQLGEGDIDIIKAPIVIDNVSYLNNNYHKNEIGVRYDESRTGRRI
jgi:hypothetical protein